MDGIIRMPGDSNAKLLRPQDVAEMTGLSYDNALALARTHGIKFGRCYYMTIEWVMEALEHMRRKET